MNLHVTRNETILREFDPEAIQSIISDSTLKAVVTARSSCNLHHNRWRCGDFSVDVGYHSFPMRAFGAFPDRRVLIGYTRRLTELTWANGFDINDEDIQFYPAGIEFDYRAGPGPEWVAVCTLESDLQAAAYSHLGRELSLPTDHSINIELPRSLRERLDRLVTRSMKASVDPSLMVAPMTIALVEALAFFDPASTEGLMRRCWQRDHHLKRANRFIESQIGSKFEVSALAAELGMTRRNVQLLFQQAYGFGPAKWLRCLALHKARHQLLDSQLSEITIKRIAYESGFHHMGRFSSYYRDLFEESPSDTLKRDKAEMRKGKRKS